MRVYAGDIVAAMIELPTLICREHASDAVRTVRQCEQQRATRKSRALSRSVTQPCRCCRERLCYAAVPCRAAAASPRGAPRPPNMWHAMPLFAAARQGVCAASTEAARKVQQAESRYFATLPITDVFATTISPHAVAAATRYASAAVVCASVRALC